MFWFPFRREVVVSSGAISSHARSIEHVLKSPRKGRLISIVLGGAEEALDSHPDNFALNLMSRKGFARLAIKHGASLVPVYHFGETSLYRQVWHKRREYCFGKEYFCCCLHKANVSNLTPCDCSEAEPCSRFLVRERGKEYSGWKRPQTKVNRMAF